MKKIELGYIDIASWNKGDKLYSDWMEKDPEDNKAYLSLDKDEIILEPKSYILVIDYPLTNPFAFEFTVSKGMSRKDFVDLAVNAYREIYKEEDETSKIKPKNIPGLGNRARTVGKYGIWGHGIEDLILHSLNLKNNDIIELGVDS